MKSENPRRRPDPSPLILLSAAVLLCVSGALAQTTTTVTGSLRDALNGALTATCSFRAGAIFTSAGGVTILTGAGPTNTAHTVSITQGALSVALLPTDQTYPAAAYEVRCHVPMQTADGRSCEGNSSLVAQGLCVVGGGDSAILYCSVPTSASPVSLKDICRTAKPAGTAATWGGLLGAGITWGNLLQPR